MNAVTTQGLIKFYGKKKALDHFSVSINEETITGVIGRNGAGKTTLLKILAGFLRSTSGKATVFQEEPFNSLFVSANTIYIDDTLEFPPSLTLGELLQEGDRFYANWNREIAHRLFDYFSLDNDAVHENLSKGQRSTFNVIFGLASRSPLTIFDEPTAGMDASVRQDFYRALLKDYLAHPRTILLSSHHLDEVEDLLEDVLLIDEGHAELHIPMDELREYAIGLTGKAGIVNQWVYDKEVIHHEHIAGDQTYAVVKNNFFPIDEAKRLGMDVSPVPPGDVCIYLTQQKEGRIDDVFR